MIAYVGQTRDPRYIRILRELGIGECTQRGEIDSRKRDPWFHDNGAYRDWENGRPFNGVRWQRDQWRIRDRKLSPDFIVVPDLVAAGDASLAWSAAERPHVAEGERAYLAVQDGMTAPSVDRHLGELADRGLPYAGLFVGGSLPWKLETAPAWADFAHARGMRLHVGRVGVPDRVRWASAFADSIDSCLPLFCDAKLSTFLAALGYPRQAELGCG